MLPITTDLAYDSALDEDCDFVQATDGRYYCMPFFGFLYFKDQACRQPIMATNGGPCPKYQARFAYWRGLLYRRGERLPKSSAPVFRQDPDGCRPVSLAVSSIDLFALGDEVGGGFVTGKLVGR